LRSFSRKQWFALSGVLAVGTVATIWAARSCPAPPVESIREWAAISLGALWATALLALAPKFRITVVATWIALIGLIVGLDFLFPEAIGWSYENIFDPNTRWYDQTQVQGTWLLTGVFGFQSLAKLLSWLPWVLLASMPWVIADDRRIRIWLLLAILLTGSILSTSQRGPLLGATLAWIAFFSHDFVRRHHNRWKVLLPIALLGMAFITYAFTPSSILGGRVEALVNNEKAETDVGKNASYNVNFRKIMWGLSLESILRKPLGNPCIPDEEFLARGIHRTHAHNLFLHQYRERGWLWGSLHLALWIAALLSAWLSRRPEASALFGGIVCIVSQGMFDHPWFVLNHSIVLWFFLLSSFSLGSFDNLIKRKSSNAH